jgi:hypothetical protein
MVIVMIRGYLFWWRLSSRPCSSSAEEDPGDGRNLPQVIKECKALKVYRVAQLSAPRPGKADPEIEASRSWGLPFWLTDW